MTQAEGHIALIAPEKLHALAALSAEELEQRRKLRARMQEAVDCLLAALDALEALDEDLEETDPREQDDDDEPSLGSLPCHMRGKDVGDVIGDRVGAFSHNPSPLGISRNTDGDQTRWAGGCSDCDDREGDEHDGREPDDDAEEDDPAEDDGTAEEEPDREPDTDAEAAGYVLSKADVALREKLRGTKEPPLPADCGRMYKPEERKVIVHRDGSKTIIMGCV